MTIRINRPKYNGEWNEEHIKWFEERFAGEEKEISSQTVQNAHGRVKIDRGEQKPDKQDFRNLMRLVVKKGSARVSQGVSGISSYRIRMVSDHFPYNQELFSDMVACRLMFEVNLPPTKEEFSNLGDLLPDWTDRHQSKWKQERYWWFEIRHAFQRYKYFGGDFEDVPPCFNPELKESFALIVNELICQYKAIKIGWEEINDCLYTWNFPDGSIEHTIFRSPEELFYCLLHTHSICRFAGHFSPKDSISSRTKADSISLIRAESKKFKNSPEDRELLGKSIARAVELYGGSYSESKEAIYCDFAGGDQLLDILKVSCDSEIKEACERWETASDALLKYKERKYRNGGFS
jgi:hypothetical protein